MFWWRCPGQHGSRLLVVQPASERAQVFVRSVERKTKRRGFERGKRRQSPIAGEQTIGVSVVVFQEFGGNHAGIRRIWEHCIDADGPRENAAVVDDAPALEAGRYGRRRAVDQEVRETLWPDSGIRQRSVAAGESY